MPCHYSTLGVERTASLAEIRAAYLRLCKLHHPDKGGDPAMMQAVNEAYSILSVESSRAAYDRGETTDSRFDDPLTGLAMSALVGAFNAVIRERMADEEMNFDLVKAITYHLATTRRKIKDSMVNDNRGLRQAKALRRRLKHSGEGFNPLHGHLNSVIDQTILMLKSKAQERLAVKKAIELAKTYEFEFTPPKPAESPLQTRWFEPPVEAGIYRVQRKDGGSYLVME